MIFYTKTFNFNQKIPRTDGSDETFICRQFCYILERVGIISEAKQFPKTLTIGGNIAVTLWIFLGAIAAWFYNSVAGWIYLLFALFTVFIILRRLGCKSCYYCKACTMGFGRISALFFGNHNLKDPKETYGVATAVFCYILIGIMPIILNALSIMQVFDFSKMMILLLLVSFLAISLTTWIKKKMIDN